MALYGRTYEYTQYMYRVVAADNEEEARQRFEELESDFYYRFDVLKDVLMPCDARDEADSLTVSDGGECWDAEVYGYDEPTV